MCSKNSSQDDKKIHIKYVDGQKSSEEKPRLVSEFKNKKNLLKYGQSAMKRNLQP